MITIPEIPEVNPGEVATAAEHNFAWRRAVMRYASALERDIENPTPETGDVAYLEDVDLLELYEGTGWGAGFAAKDGSVAAPQYTFAAAINTGLFRDPGGAAAMSINGVLAALFGTSLNLDVGDGTDGRASILNTSAAPSFPTYAFVGDTTTGHYRLSAGVIGWATGGTQRMRLDFDRLELDAGTHFLAQPFTTGQAADAAWVDIGGGIKRIQQNTSARKYKSEIVYV